MKPYGITGYDFGAWHSPDVGDCVIYGAQSSRMNICGKGGDIKNSCRSSKAKRACRRYYKRLARAFGKRVCGESFG